MVLFFDDDHENATPPWSSIRELQTLPKNLEDDENIDVKKWLFLWLQDLRWEEQDPKLIL